MSKNNMQLVVKPDYNRNPFFNKLKKKLDDSTSNQLFKDFSINYTSKLINDQTDDIINNPNAIP